MLRDRLQIREVRVTRGETSGQRLLMKDRFFNFDFGVRELLDQHLLAIELRATALYGYARYYGDTDVTRAYHVSSPDVTLVIEPGIWNAIKWHLTRAVQSVNQHELEMHNKHVEESGIEFDLIQFPWVCKWPVWMRPKTRRVPSIKWDEYEIKVDRIQEGLVAQMVFLHNLGLDPRAVLAAPDIVEFLAGAEMPAEENDYGTNIPDTGTFMGVPIIVCRDMVHGAIVV